VWVSCASLLRHLGKLLLRLEDSEGQTDITKLMDSFCNFSYVHNIYCVNAAVPTALLRSAGGQASKLQSELRAFRKGSKTREAAESKSVVTEQAEARS